MLNKAFILIFFCTFLSGCNLTERLSRVGVAPDMNRIHTYEDDMVPPYDSATDTLFGSRGDNYSNAAFLNEESKSNASLWKTGARTFFRDQRARAIGDILKVLVTINDQAKLNNQTQASRNDTDTTSAPNFLGFESLVHDIFPPAFNPSKLLNLSAADSNNGIGQINRKESINTTIATTVVKILPSNNLVIRGSQEIRVNYEVREVTIEGIVRPEDISADNSVSLDQVAEARVSYGGRGNLSDYQQPRYGKQIADAISPF